MGRVGRWIVGAALFVIVCTVLVPVVLVVRVACKGRAVAGEIARIQAAGDPVCAADLTGKPIPANKNAALVYDRSFAYLPRSSDSRDSNVLAEFLRPHAREVDPHVWSEAKAIVNRYEPALSMAEKAVLMPECRFRVDWRNPFNAKFPYYPKLRFLARLASARAVLEAKAGNAQGAARSVTLALRISDAFKDEPGLVAALVRFSTIRTASNALVDCAECVRLTEADARSIAQVARQIDLRDSITDAMKAERAMGIIVFSQVRSGKVRGLSSSGDIPDAVKTYRSFPFGLVLSYDEQYYLDQMQDRIQRSALPYRDTQRRWQENVSLEGPRYAVISALLTPVGYRSTMARDRAVTSLAGSQVFLGLLAYRDRFGSYPDRLDELKSRLAWNVPEDPFSGKPFVYRRTGQGFILYSIGDDLKDSGGTQLRRGGPGDVVWKLDR